MFCRGLKKSQQQITRSNLFKYFSQLGGVEILINSRVTLAKMRVVGLVLWRPIRSELGGVHKLCWQDFVFFWPPTPLRWHFIPYKSWQILTFLDYLPSEPTSFCQCSLWMTPYGSCYVNFVVKQIPTFIIY